MCFSRRSIWEEEADRTRIGSSRDLLGREPEDEAVRPVPVAERDEAVRPVPVAERDEAVRPVPAAERDEDVRPVPVAERDECEREPVTARDRVPAGFGR